MLIPAVRLIGLSCYSLQFILLNDFSRHTGQQEVRGTQTQTSTALYRLDILSRSGHKVRTWNTCLKGTIYDGEKGFFSCCFFNVGTSSSCVGVCMEGKSDQT